MPRRQEPDTWTLKPGATRKVNGEKVYILPDPAIVAGMVAAALKAGTHGPPENFRTVCDGCRNWVSGIFWISPDKRRLCKECAPVERT
jgi:hypothetical protein